jgi:ribosomal protein S27E
MTDDPIVCGSPGDEYTVALKCPDCGPRDMDVVQYDRGRGREGVVRVRCPGCGSDLFTNGTVPCARMKRKAQDAEWAAEPTAHPNGGNDDDGQ